MRLWWRDRTSVAERQGYGSDVAAAVEAASVQVDLVAAARQALGSRACWTVASEVEGDEGKVGGAAAAAVDGEREACRRHSAAGPMRCMAGVVGDRRKERVGTV